jgi:pseudouridine-5'-phosphate glycosidase
MSRPGGPVNETSFGDEVKVGDEVREALREGRPVVALESTIISHGLPQPRNLEVALQLEEVVRLGGAVPATVGVTAGRPVVGLSREDIELLATEEHVAKASIRELPVAMAAGRHAATTVAATAFLARRAGIRAFATGGLGGVRRGAAETFDESADLGALSRTPITVVSAGVKSVLDVAATLERFESLGVTIVGFRTTRMPGFYVADAGIDLDWSVSSPAEVAAIMSAADSLSLQSAILVANPIPVSQQLDPDTHDRLLDAALRAAERDGVRGKQVTPYLLDHIYRASGGASLEANVAAVRNNATLAAAVAVAFASPAIA